MTFAPGTSLGTYELLTPLGAGGMGEVWKARDSKLGREVAVKVLPEAFGADAERLARFQQEAKALAALSHPNILTIFEFGVHEGSPFLVMELLEGETLRERLGGRSMSPRRAVELALQVANGLAAAHEQGIIHRDLKPENLFLTKDGRVKLLDFGLAKLRPQAAGSQVETQGFLSEPGTVVGTSGYMSPEQVQGGEVDARSDLFSLGVVLWEMLTGRAPFRRESALETMHAILKEEAPELDPALKVPPGLVRILESCLAKAPEGRFHSAHDLAFALEALSTSAGSTSRDRNLSGVRIRKGKFATASIAGFALLAGLIAGGIVSPWGQAFRMGRAVVSPAPLRAMIELPVDAPLAIGGDIPAIGYYSPLLAVSPNGSRIAYVAKTPRGQRICVIETSTGQATPQPGTEGAIHPFFSPDGQWIGFLTVDRVKKVSMNGGEVVSLCQARMPVLAWWAAPGLIHFTEDETSTLSRVSAEGGVPERCFNVGEVTSPVRLGGISDVLPGGAAVLVSGGDSIGRDHHDIMVVDIATRQARTLLKKGYAPRYVAPDHLLFARAGCLMAAKFDLKRQEVSGPERILAKGVAMESLFGQLHASCSTLGLAAFVPGGDLSVGRPAKVPALDGGGPPEFLDAPERVYGSIGLRSDGKRFAVAVADVPDFIWIYDCNRRNGYKLAGSDGEGRPAWGPTGRQLATCRRNRGVIVRDIDESGTEPHMQVLGADLKAREYSSVAWSPTGDTLAFVAFGSIHFAGLDKPVGNDACKGVFPTFSPDGRWIAFVSGRSGTYEIVLRSHPEGRELGRPVSLDGGTEPVWKSTGELYYRKGGRWFVTHVRTGPDPEWEPPRMVFNTDFIDTPGMSYDIYPGGRHLLVVKRVNAVEGTKIAVIANWTAELFR